MIPILKTIMSSLFSKSATVSYPLAPKEPFEATRGHIDIEIEKCIFCGICQKKCPTGAIIVDKNEKSWTISRYDCLQCNFCADSCPKKCLLMCKQLPDAMNELISNTVKLEIKNEPEDSIESAEQNA